MLRIDAEALERRGRCGARQRGQAERDVGRLAARAAQSAHEVGAPPADAVRLGFVVALPAVLLRRLDTRALSVLARGQSQAQGQGEC